MTSLVEAALEKHSIQVRDFADARHTAVAVASRIADLIRSKQAENASCVLGLATGSTPIPVYAELVRLHRDEGLSFTNVISFNLDEYHPMKSTDDKSYHAFMHHHLFGKVDIDPTRAHVPDGETPLEEVDAYCARYEAMIVDAGGLDLQLLGIGRTGHIGFNEPGSSLDSRTRRVELVPLTRSDAADGFGGIDHVPTHAITMGIQTILAAREIVLMATGSGKKEIVAKTLGDHPTSSDLPATYLRGHGGVTFFVDQAAI